MAVLPDAGKSVGLVGNGDPPSLHWRNFRYQADKSSLTNAVFVDLVYTYLNRADLCLGQPSESYRTMSNDKKTSRINSNDKEMLPEESKDPSKQASDSEKDQDQGKVQPPTDAIESPPRNPFDPAALRINPETAAGAIGVKRKILSVSVGRPEKTDFVRVHPDQSFRLDTALIEDKRNREFYLVGPTLWPELPDFISLVRICVSVTRHGTPFLWSAKLPDPNHPNAWLTTMLEAQELAINAWVRVQSDRSAGSYAVFEATGNLPEPQWPDLSLQQM